MPSSIVYTASIITGICVVVGTLLIIPAFMHDERPQFLLSFEIQPHGNISEFCKDLSTLLNRDNIKSAIFISGKLAEQNPQCITLFGENTDIGSQTYSYTELPIIVDYLEQLREVELGKKTIDDIGNFNTKLFKAPGMNTDDNIFSLLSKNNIEFDLSYSDHYNKFYEGQFLRFDLAVLDWREIPSINFSKLDKEIPILISIDNSVSIKDIEDVINQLKTKNVRLINPSDIMKKDLTPNN